VTDRLAQFLDELDRRSLADLQVLSLPEIDPEARAELLQRVTARARFAGAARVAEANAARSQVHDIVARWFRERAYQPTFAGLSWMTGSLPARDIRTLTLAIEDAAVAAVLADVLDPDDAADLRHSYEIASSMSGAGWTGAPGFERGGRAAVAAMGVFVLTGGIGLGGALAALIGRRRRARGPSD
jgi:hypothetical protein